MCACAPLEPRRAARRVVAAALPPRRALAAARFRSPGARGSPRPVVGVAGWQAEEEARERKRLAAEAKRLAEEEAALKDEWRTECARLRSQQPTSVAVQMLVDAASKGDGESSAALDKMAPISLSDFKVCVTCCCVPLRAVACGYVV